MQIFYEFCVLTLWLFFPASFSFFCYMGGKEISLFFICVYMENRKDINISASSHKSACLLLFSNPCCIHNIYWELADCTRKTSSSIDITHYCYPIEERKRSSSSHNSSIVFIYIEWVSELERVNIERFVQINIVFCIMSSSWMISALPPLHLRPTILSIIFSVDLYIFLLHKKSELNWHEMCVCVLSICWEFS